MSENTSTGDSQSVGQFEPRHIGLRDADRTHMLATVGYVDLDELTSAAIPDVVKANQAFELPPAVGESEIQAELRALAEQNHTRTPMLGMGYYGTHTPAVIRRNVLENPAWYTAYTPYQPEISQGRLEALLVFQTMVADLTGLKIANASLLDESTAVAEAMSLARRVSKVASNRYLIDIDTHPQTLAVLETRSAPLGIELVAYDVTSPLPDGEFFGLLVSYPGSSGRIVDVTALIEQAKSSGAIVAVTTDLLALTLLRSPGELGADIAVGSAQRFGVPLGFGGPHAGFMSVRPGLERNLPGRLVGVSTDTAGQPAYRLALQTREQHIRRERATSNICTSQVLLAVISALFAAYHGAPGLRRIALKVHRRAIALACALQAADVLVEHTNFFDTVTVRLDARARGALVALAVAGIDVRFVDEDHIGISLDETTTDAEVATVVATITGSPPPGKGAVLCEELSIPDQLVRSSAYLTHPWFDRYRSETSMMRWLRRMADADLALDRTMIPLGSCTMKLNPAAAMEPISWPGFANVHPFAPAESTAGYSKLIHNLEDYLSKLTGYDAVSLQPNAGSQGEFAGLLAIQAYHHDRSDTRRNVCLIPASAHGTNAASAVMAGMAVVVLACDDTGGVDVADLRKKVVEHADVLSAIMITYPSTYGVYEDTIHTVCELVHDAGGQVYVDGANLNALVGLAAPGKFGADVSHLNLHKTFCIPHGGGGPGIGPVAVRAHLAPYLPSHPMRPELPDSRHSDSGNARITRVGAISAAPWGSAGILPIPYAYIRMMGAQGLRRATQNAVLAANYIAKRLSEHYPVLYTGRRGLVAHECILDLRDITKKTGVTVDDVAKRLIDYGFHAPTMSFPISGTLMVEPTESEDRAELDRFCDAMIAIRNEISRVAAGEWPVDDSPLSNAPHTATSIAGEWLHPYSRELAVYPVAGMARSKYWPPVGRIDSAYGDRNLMCECPPPEAFE